MPEYKSRLMVANRMAIFCTLEPAHLAAQVSHFWRAQKLLTLTPEISDVEETMYVNPMHVVSVEPYPEGVS